MFSLIKIIRGSMLAVMVMVFAYLLNQAGQVNKLKLEIKNVHALTAACEKEKEVLQYAIEIERTINNLSYPAVLDGMQHNGWLRD